MVAGGGVHCRRSQIKRQKSKIVMYIHVRVRIVYVTGGVL